MSIFKKIDFQGGPVGRSTKIVFKVNEKTF